MADPHGHEVNTDASADPQADANSDAIEDLAPSYAPSDVRGGGGKVPYMTYTLNEAFVGSTSSTPPEPPPQK
jgi:hypothetical protein